MKKITLLKTKIALFGLLLFAALFLNLAASRSFAQTAFCTNEVVIWTENFGRGQNSTPEPNTTNALQYQAHGDLETEGVYRCSNDIHQKVEWHFAPDHTPNDVNGKMMVVNGNGAGAIYRKRVNSPNGFAIGDYSLSLYIMNANTPGTCSPDPILPKIALRLDYQDDNGDWIQLNNSPFVSGTIPQTATPTWVQVGGIFTLPPTGSFLVKRLRVTLIDLAIGSCGNDYGIDDIKLATCPAGGPLPVQFLNVSAQKKGSGVAISWATASEINNEYFDVEKSNDGGLNWYNVTRTQGSGNSSMTKNYGAYDAKPSVGANYYRIKQVDVDGNSKYSATVVYKLAITKTDISVLANPFTSNITIDFLSDRSQTVNSRLFDNTGRQALSQTITLGKGAARKTIDANKLTRGMYILQITDEAGQILLTDKLIKQ